MDIKYDSSFDKTLDNNICSILSNFFTHPFKYNYESDIRDIIVNNNFKTGKEGWIHYELKDLDFPVFASSMFEKSDYDGKVKEILSSKSSMEILNDHTMTTVFLDCTYDKELVHPMIQNSLSDMISYIKDTSIHIEVIYFNLGPQGVVVPHSDGSGHEEYYNAVINLKCPKEGCSITVNGNTTTVFEKDIFLFNAQEIHSARNPSIVDNWEFLAFRLKTSS